MEINVVEQRVIKSSIACYYFGTDPWGPVRWHRYLAVFPGYVLRVFPSELAAGKDTSNVELLKAAGRSISEDSIPPLALEASLCVIDFDNEDLDEEVLSRLASFIFDLKAAMAFSGLKCVASASSPVIVQVPYTLMVHRDWIASTGADLVVERTRDLSEIVVHAAGSMPRFAKPVHPWLSNLAIDSGCGSQ